MSIDTLLTIFYTVHVDLSHAVSSLPPPADFTQRDESKESQAEQKQLLALVCKCLHESLCNTLYNALEGQCYGSSNISVCTKGCTCRSGCTTLALG